MGSKWLLYFWRNSNDWSLQQKIVASDPTLGAIFGASVSTYNNIISYMSTNVTGRVIISTVTTLLPYLTFGFYAIFYLSSNSLTCYFATGETSSKNMAEVF